MKPTYGETVIETSSTSDVSKVVTNQEVPVVTNAEALDSSIFKPWPIEIQCPFCHNRVKTEVEEKFNCKSLVFCWGCLPCSICIQCYRHKSLLCSDSIHFCPNCKTEIGKYEAC